MKANTKLYSTQYSALRKISKFKCTLNKDKKIFKVQSQVQVSITFKYKYNLSSSVMTLI